MITRSTNQASFVKEYTQHYYKLMINITASSHAGGGNGNSAQPFQGGGGGGEQELTLTAKVAVTEVLWEGSKMD